MRTKIRMKRIYDKPSEEDGYRVLVDRLWPRGIKKTAAKIDWWAKELTPSNELRKWFHTDLSRQQEFAIRYREELKDRLAEIKPIIDSLRRPTITLVTAAKDLEHGHVEVLKKFLTAKWKK